MPERYLQSYEVIDLAPEEDEVRIAELKKALGSRQVRRMSALGVMVASALRSIPVGRETVVLYATTYTESRALEAYLESLPYASPTHFQTSIHPGGIEQALILNQWPVGALYPLCGQADLVGQALALVGLESREEVLLVLGEERGGWLAEAGVASLRSYVVVARWTLQAEGALARLQVEPPLADGGQQQGDPGGYEFVSLMAERRDINWCSAHGTFQLEWMRA